MNGNNVEYGGSWRNCANVSNVRVTLYESVTLPGGGQQLNRVNGNTSGFTSTSGLYTEKFKVAGGPRYYVARIEVLDVRGSTIVDDYSGTLTVP